ncbi:MAG: UDP-2,3-diacylglucosamine diphosphatase [Mariniphaga sp.]|nr:UDP-2,3-diacylglucosamine diphosphatase [Mariniphaga sp.]
MNLSRNIYFASDVHLGSPALKHNRERELLFVSWLHQIKKDAAAIFLLGDIFDFWFEYRKVAPQGFVRVLGALAEICDSGIPVHFFTGNHDIWVFDYLPRETGMIIHHKPLETELFGKKFFLAHGDDLGKTDFKYQLLTRFFHNKLAQWAFAKVHPDLSFRLAHYWSKNSRLSRGVNGEGFLGEEREHQILFARKKLKEEHFDYFVFGHRHIALDFQLTENSKIIILGDWFKGSTYGVWDGNTFRLEKIINETLTKSK